MQLKQLNDKKVPWLVRFLTGITSQQAQLELTPGSPREVRWEDTCLGVRSAILWPSLKVKRDADHDSKVSTQNGTLDASRPYLKMFLMFFLKSQLLFWSPLWSNMEPGSLMKVAFQDL